MTNSETITQIETPSIVIEGNHENWRLIDAHICWFPSKCLIVRKKYQDRFDEKHFQLSELVLKE